MQKEGTRLLTRSLWETRRGEGEVGDGARYVGFKIGIEDTRQPQQQGIKIGDGLQGSLLFESRRRVKDGKELQRWEEVEQQECKGKGKEQQHQHEDRERSAVDCNHSHTHSLSL
jgi:hypothetical protein